MSGIFPLFLLLAEGHYEHCLFLSNVQMAQILREESVDHTRDRASPRTQHHGYHYSQDAISEEFGFTAVTFMRIGLPYMPRRKTNYLSMTGMRWPNSSGNIPSSCTLEKLRRSTQMVPYEVVVLLLQQTFLCLCIVSIYKASTCLCFSILADGSRRCFLSTMAASNA